MKLQAQLVQLQEEQGQGPGPHTLGAQDATGSQACTALAFWMASSPKRGWVLRQSPSPRSAALLMAPVRKPLREMLVCGRVESQQAALSSSCFSLSVALRERPPPV